MRKIKDASLLTLSEVYEELGIAKSTFNDWVCKGRAPKRIKLPNGKIRIRRKDLAEWLENWEMSS